MNKKGLSKKDCPKKLKIVTIGLMLFAAVIGAFPKDPKTAELPELVVESRGKKLLHVLAYVREYSTLATLTDTVFLFREKMVDYMLPVNRRVTMTGWSTPRILTSKSYYRFSNAEGLDSVSDENHNHFSWADWIGIAPLTPIPAALDSFEYGSETVGGKYSARELWEKENDVFRVTVDILADQDGPKWVPGLARFLKKDIDFNHLKVRYDYENVIGNHISPLDLSGYSFSIGSTGRGHDMFRFNKYYETVYVTTDAEVYIFDREVITEKEARKWERSKFDVDEIGIYEPQNTPELSPEILALIDRISNLDKSEVKLDYEPDPRLLKKHDGRHNFKIGRRALFMLKDATGISHIKRRKDQKRRWNEFRHDRLERNEIH